MSNRTKERVIALIDSPSESPRERARILEGTLHLSRWMGCGLRVISGNVFEVLALTRAMRRSGPWARIQVSFVGLGTDSPGGSSGIEKILAMDQELIVLAVSKKEASSTELVGWKRKIAERSAAPVLLLPPRKNIAETGFASLLVPMSGEARLNSALAWAVRAANEHHIPVDVLHVTEMASVDVNAIAPS